MAKPCLGITARLLQGKRFATANDVIDPQPYIGADTVIARDMDDIITFASPRKQTAQPLE